MIAKKFEWLSERIAYPWPKAEEDPLKLGPVLWKLLQSGEAIGGDT